MSTVAKARFSRAGMGLTLAGLAVAIVTLISTAEPLRRRGSAV